MRKEERLERLSKHFNKEHVYQALFEDNPSIYLIIDANSGQIVHANKAACDYYQYTYDELVRMNINNINILSEDDIKAEMDKARIEERNYFNLVHRLSNNEYRRVEVKSTPIIFDSEEYLFSAVTDITEKHSRQLMIHDLFYKSPNAMVILDDEKNVLTLNPSFTELFGYTLEELINKPLNLTIVSTKYEDNLHKNLNLVMKGEVVNTNTIRQTKDKRLIDVNLIATPYQIGDEVMGALLVYTDITEQIKIKKEIEEHKNQLQLLINSTVEGIYGIDLEGNCTFCNVSGLKLLGYESQDEVLGKNMHELIHHSYKDGRRMPLDDCKIYKACNEGKGIDVSDEVFFRKDGTSFDVTYHSYPQTKDGITVGAVVTFMDYTERKKYEENIEYISYHDSLTKLYNREYFIKKMEDFDKEEYYPLSIIFGDLNGLKLTNDIFGHLAGDDLLKTASFVLKSSCRREDIVARVGGDEFAILLPNTNSEIAEKVMNRIRSEISKRKVVAIKGNISLGYETKENSTQNIEEVLEKAEKWMYKDKMMNQKKIQSDLVTQINETLYSRNPFEKIHAIHVSDISVQIAMVLGLKHQDIRKVKEAAYLHDIGKIILDEDLLKESRPLTKEEKNKIEQHPVIGYRILNLFDDTLDLADLVLNHHEHFDGSGFPRGIKADEIPLLARIIAVAESYDSMMHEPSSPILSKEEAKAKIKRLAGIKYDPKVVEAFLQIDC